MHIPEKEPSRVTPATARRRARSQRSLLHLDSELDVSMSVTQLSIDDPHTTPFPNLQRQPIFRPLAGKRLSNNPYVDPRSSVDLYNYSVHMTNSPNLRPMASASLANLSEMSDELNVLGGELDSSQHLPAHPLPQPQQHTLPVPLADSLSVTVSEPSQASLRHAPQLAPAPAPAPSPGQENHYVSLYRPSTGSFRHQSLDPLPFQVHSRVLGWKLTSVQRRKELVGVLDMMKEKAHKLSSLSKSSLARRHVNTFTADDFLRDMAAASSSADPDDPRKSTTREAEAWQSYVTRNVQSRQNYKSPQHIRSLMEDKRRTEKLTEFSAQRNELLRNRAAAQQKRRPDLLNERSTDESLERRNQQILRQLNIPALPTPKAGARRSASTPKLGSPKSRPRSQQAQDSAQHLYNFPKNIYKPRDRMVRAPLLCALLSALFSVSLCPNPPNSLPLSSPSPQDILESVQIRSRLEGHLSREREAQKERLVADFLADGLDMFSSDSAAHRGLDDGSDFASLADSFLAGGLEPLDMDSALEKFGRGLQREPEFDDIEADLLAAEEDVDG